MPAPDPDPDPDPTMSTAVDAAASTPSIDAGQSAATDAGQSTATDATQSAATDATESAVTDAVQSPPDRSRRRVPSGSIAFGDLTRAAYCPRQLYYARQETDRSIPETQRARIDLAFQYAELVTADDSTLSDRPIDPRPAVYRDRLQALRDTGLRERFGVPWQAFVEPTRTRAFLIGRSCHGIAHKVLSGDDVAATAATADTSDTAATAATPDTANNSDTPSQPPLPILVSPGSPPDQGVWEPQTVRAVAIAKALAWEHNREIPRVLVEYPAVGIVRSVTLTVRSKAAYRRTLRTTRGIDGPPPRVSDDRCSPCAYRDQCGTKTRSLRSRLGL